MARGRAIADRVITTGGQWLGGSGFIPMSVIRPIAFSCPTPAITGLQHWRSSPSPVDGQLLSHIGLKSLVEAVGTVSLGAIAVKHLRFRACSNGKALLVEGRTLNHTLKDLI